MKTPKYRYWDATCFIAWLKEEAGRIEACEGVVQAAQKGELKIVTSAITLVEVIKPGSELVMTKNTHQAIVAFFEQPYIIVRDVDRNVAEQARLLIWTYPHLRSRDSVHAATAILTDEVNVLDTFDSDLLKLNGQIGDPPLLIGEPHLPFQPQLKEPDDLAEE